jgi:hypothetical protein
MAKRDWAERLRRFLRGLKRQTMTDGRLQYPQSTDLDVGSTCWFMGSGRNWRVYEWQIWSSLQIYGRHPKVAQFTEHQSASQIAPPFAVDEYSLLFASEDENNHLVFYLVWRSDDHFGFRILGESETRRVSELSHAMMRSQFGIHFHRLPVHGVPFRGPDA